MGHGRERWGDAVNELERVLGELDDRAKNGLTASKLIEAATADREDAGEAVAKSQEQVLTAGAINDDLRSALDDRTREVEELRKPRTQIELEDSVVNYKYSPAAGKEMNRRNDALALWRLGEIESALTHLRVNGAGDDTQVRITGGDLHAKLEDTGVPPQGWSFPVPEPIVKVKRRTPLWFMLASPAIAGVGFVLAALIGVI